MWMKRWGRGQRDGWSGENEVGCWLKDGFMGNINERMNDLTFILVHEWIDVYVEK